MKKIISILVLLYAVCTIELSSQNVSDVSFKIIGDRAVINYRLDKEADVYLYVSTKEDEGWNTSFMNWGVYQTTAPALRAVKGDVGRRVTPGQNKQIVWSFKDETAPFFERTENGITGIFVINKHGTTTSSLLNSLQFKVEACPSTDEPDMVWVDGCDGLGDYWIGRYPVTVYEFSKFIEETGYITQAEKQGYGEIWDLSNNDWRKQAGVNWRCDEAGNERDKSEYEFYPVVYVSWEDANEYCKWLGHKYNKDYSLPDFRIWYEACACLIPGTLSFSLRLDVLAKDWIQENIGGNPNEIGWFNFNSDYKIHQIGRKRPNLLNIYDMRGNIYEWSCNPINEAGKIIILKSDYEVLERAGKLNNFLGMGGSAFEPYDKTENADRYWSKKATGINIGFRVCMYPNENSSWKNYLPSK